MIRFPLRLCGEGRMEKQRIQKTITNMNGICSDGCICPEYKQFNPGMMIAGRFIFILGIWSEMRHVLYAHHLSL